jgi:hypothetical protein
MALFMDHACEFATYLLMEIASGPERARMLLSRSVWMETAKVTAPERVCIFLAVFSHLDLREDVVGLKGVPKLRKEIVATGDADVIALIEVVQ